MHKRCDAFGVTLHNVPLINLRFEFNTHHDLLAEPGFQALFAPGAVVQPLRTPYMVWGGMPGAFLTLLLQRAFSGLEAYVVGATHIRLGELGVGVLARARAKLANPFVLGGKGAAENYYDRLPSMASGSYSLKHHSPQLWERTTRLYSQVRNPVFHGHEVEAESVAGVFEIFEHLADLYRWIDSWCDPESVMPGAGQALPPRPRGAA